VRCVLILVRSERNTCSVEILNFGSFHPYLVAPLLDEEIAVDEAGEEARPVRTTKNPSLPSREEQDQHATSHLPHRSWCKVCVMAKGKEAAHSGSTRADSATVVHVDFAFLNFDGKEKAEASQSW
jgi:hypothetical protein